MVFLWHLVVTSVVSDRIALYLAMEYSTVAVQQSIAACKSCCRLRMKSLMLFCTVSISWTDTSLYFDVCRCYWCKLFCVELAEWLSYVASLGCQPQQQNDVYVVAAFCGCRGVTSRCKRSVHICVFLSELIAARLQCRLLLDSFMWNLKCFQTGHVWLHMWSRRCSVERFALATFWNTCSTTGGRACAHAYQCNHSH